MDSILNRQLSKAFNHSNSLNLSSMLDNGISRVALGFFCGVNKLTIVSHNTGFITFNHADGTQATTNEIKEMLK